MCLVGKKKNYLCIASGFGLPHEKQKLQWLPDDVCSCLLDERLQDGASLSDCCRMEQTHYVLVAGMDGEAPGRKEALHLPI